MIFAEETEVLGENLPSATVSTTNPTWIDPGANPGLRGERPATNRLSHGTALSGVNGLSLSTLIAAILLRGDIITEDSYGLPHTEIFHPITSYM
jgi:hypothetical protein